MTEIVDRPAAAGPLTGPNWGLTKFLDPLPVPPVLRPPRREQDMITIPMVPKRQRLHSQLPPTALWTYAGHFPGPTIEVRSGRQLRISWSNEITGEFPLVAVAGPVGDAPTSRPGRELDRPGYSIVDGVADLPAWTVVHLHGARTNAGNDGWAHNAGLRGTSQLAEYPNRQQAMPLWYHDHAMAITRFTVHTGLAGMYLIRDDEEDELGLPGGDLELPLILADRNLDTDPETGALTGQLLYKFPYVPNGPMIPFSGPFTLVNGVIWPHLDVPARWYRFRLLNAANERFFTLNLVDEDNVPRNDAVRLIGTDGGLLPAPARLPSGGLTVAPAERFDLLVDFSRFRGRKLKLRNADPRLGGVEPDVMEFRVDSREKPDPFELPEKLSRSYARIKHGSTLPEDHDHVWVALLLNASGHPEMWDLEQIDADPGGKGVIQLKDPAGGLKTFRVVGRVFDDTTGVFLDHGKWAVWNIVHVANGGPAHPFHIHLTEFQALFRRGFTTTFDPVAERTTTAIDGFTEIPLEKYEEGWKDTIIVNPGQWVGVAGQFSGGTGEFMYHCHILDHEDEGMMRPFVVHPPEVAKFHVHPGGGHHHDG
ncbi:multicopper oxidase family protein [Amycolatopsis orientalis]|uniref:multicopper oxidase family protein n=1 Tax=Amycolatopsis orientalis TaxID=31958 RepID=UPI0003A94136|nr:multicopper oxidase domain-containing protein [Amycolatopsis orientalis]